MPSSIPSNIQDLISSALSSRVLPNGNILFISKGDPNETDGENDGDEKNGDNDGNNSGDYSEEERGDDDDTEIFYYPGSVPKHTQDNDPGSPPETA